MYKKNLTNDFRLRISETDMNFLRDLAEERDTSVSECVRYIIGEYRRSIETIDMINSALGGLSYGDTKTDLDNKL